MLFDKQKYVIQVNHGKGQIITKDFRGLLCDIFVEPEKHKKSVVYDLSISDFENDEIYFDDNIKGKIFRNVHIPVGQSKSEPLIIKLSGSTHNINFKVILLTQER